MRKIFVLTFLTFPIFNSLIAQDQVFNFEDKESLILAFGSCNRQNLEQPLWGPIIDHNPDLFMFLGDNIYGDTDDMKLLEEKYLLQKNHADYKRLRSAMPLIGVWDDHDYGKNDAGQEYPFKEESQQLFLDFFDVDENDPRRDRQGVYSSYNLEWKSHIIKVILLDTRYHRSDLERINRVYQKNEEGTILGNAQWDWLESELSDQEVSLFIIASGIQMIPKDHDYEKWANFPQERERLLKLIQDNEPQRTLLLSGDRHIGEVSRMDLESLDYPLLEVTSSGLTHIWENAPEEPNRYRIGELIKQLNYGVIKIEETANGLSLEIEIRGRGQELLHFATLSLH